MKSVFFHSVLICFVLVAMILTVFLGLALFDTVYASRILEQSQGRQHASFVRRGDDYVAASPRMIQVAFPAEKSTDAFRVFILGGSQAMGSPYVHQRFSGLFTQILGLSNEGGIATWLSGYLEDLLPGREIEVINAARGGGSLGDALPTLREIIAIGNPDRVIILSGNNERVEDDSLGFEEAVARMTRNYAKQLQTVIALAEENAIQLSILTVPTNIRDWLPHAPSAANFPELHRWLQPEEWAAIATKLEADEVGEPNDGLVVYASAKRAEAEGDMTKAKALYIRAKDLDREFARARSQWNDIVRQIRSPNARVLDLENILAGYAEFGIPGFDLFHDHCHFKLRGNSIAAYEIAKDIGRAMDLFVEPGFREEAASVGISSWEMQVLYVAKAIKWFKMQYYSGMSGVMGINAREVALRYRHEEESLSAVEHKIGAAKDLATDRE